MEPQDGSLRAHSLPRGGLITTNLADIVQRAREMVSKETQIFVSWFWLRWEPGLVRKSEVPLSPLGPCFLWSPLPTLSCSYFNSIPQTWPALPFLSTTVASLLVSVCSFSVYLSQPLYRLKHLGKFANSTKIAINGYYSYRIYYVPESSQESLLLFPSSQQSCDREDTICSSNDLSPFFWNYISQPPLLLG